MTVHDEDAKSFEPVSIARRSQLGIVGGAFVLVMAGRIVGAAFSPLLLAHAPLALLFLSPVIAHLVIVAALCDPIPYFLAAVPTAIAHCFLGFYLGQLQGPRIVEFLIRKRFASESKINRLLSPLRVSAPLLVFAIPGPLVCALAGASAVPRRTFLPALVASQVLWVIVCRWFGQTVLGSIAALREGLVRHALPLTVVTVLIVVLIRFRGVWKRK